MTSNSLDPNQDIELDPQKEYRALVRSIRWTKGFGLLFVQCSPAEGNRLIARVREDLPEKRIEVLSLKESIDNLYDVVDALPNKAQIDVLFVQGLEHSLYEYERTQLWEKPRDRYTYSDKGIPRLLGNLNLGRERFSGSFKLKFVFLVPTFVIKYLAHRAPDFFDWRSGVLEFSTLPKHLQDEVKNFLQRSSSEVYDNLTREDYIQRILMIQAWLHEKHLSDDSGLDLVIDLHGLLIASGDIKVGAKYTGRNYASSSLNVDDKKIEPVKLTLLGAAFAKAGQYEQALDCFDSVVLLDSCEAQGWKNRAVCLLNLERYEEAVMGFDLALKLENEDYEAWYGRGYALLELEQYEEAIISYDNALKLKPDYDIVLYYKACCYGIQEQKELALITLEQAISLNSEYRKEAATDSVFDSIRNDDRFQALINETE